MNKAAAMVCHHVKKAYQDANQSLEILKGIDCTIAEGEQVAIIGRSGSGKTTLLQLMGGLDIPTSGRVSVGEHAWQDLSEAKRCALRNASVGFIYQFHHLLPEFTALENVALPMLIGQKPVRVARERACALLEKVGLAERLTHYPAQLSGGERQRVAIARALVNQPKIVLADEPTGNLDAEHAHGIFEVLQTLNRKEGTTLVIVTHDLQLANRLDTVYELKEGQLTQDLSQEVA